ncbi:MAG TPA: hypothetical protein VFH53_06035 [Phycisphaerae bacterium]|nr:hypothetical protein [Phycisphaerae bacterium]HUX02250.1 hypothetical protein [Phycisphaerae bacterium]
MAITVEEKRESRICDLDRAELHFFVRGTPEGSDARAELLAWLVAEGLTGYDGKVLKSVRIEPIHVDTTAGNEETCVWEGVADYAPSGASEKIETEIGDVILSVDTTGGTIHVQQSEGTVICPRAGELASDFLGAIGVHADGTIEGVDVPSPAMRLSVTKIWDPADPLLPGIGAIFALGGKTNDGPYTLTDTKTGRSMAFAAGECRFLGHREGGRRADGGLEINYEFDAQPNRAEWTIPGTTIKITGGKKGWQYLWFYYRDEADDVAKMLVPRAWAAYVETLREHEEKTLTALGVGTGPPP